MEQRTLESRAPERILKPDAQEKKVSLWKSVLFTICSILVLDTFVAPALIGVSSITVWLITAVVFFVPYGLLSAELGSTYPDDGGICSWVGRAFGERASVLTGWYYWVNVAFWMPAVFVAFAYWFSYAFAPNAPAWVLAGVAGLMCWLIVWIGVRGLELSVTVSSIAAVCKVAVLLLFGGLGVAYGVRYGLANDFSLRSFVPSINHTTQYVAVIVYNLLGFELIGSIGSQIENPGKTVPRMTVVSGTIITALYVFGTFGILAAIPAAQVDTVDGFYFALQELCTVFGAGSGAVFYLVIIVAMLTLISNMVSWSLGANEALIGAGLDVRSRFLGHRSKFGTADHLYYVMGAVATLLIVLNFMLSGDANAIFWTILAFSTLIFLLPYLFMFPAALKLRYCDADTPRSYRVGGRGNAGMWICTVLCELCVAGAVFFLFKGAEPGFPRWMLIIGTALTTVAGFWLDAAGRKNG